MTDTKPVDTVKLKLKGKGKHNDKVGSYDGYLEMKENKFSGFSRKKIFICNKKNEAKATEFERYKTMSDKSGYFYRVKGSENEDGESLWLDEITKNGFVFAIRSRTEDVLGATGNIHSWVEGMSNDKKQTRLFACLGTDLSQEALALPRKGLGDHDQHKSGEKNGGSQVFCNGKFHRDGLAVTVEEVS
ncbi:hypothetical protein [Endozoicomonas lisbonensis]|uniref:Uncharacterized protein n=1 Tax=Endozoicomonas lisbonensis TaxID=3120522 RepID=A0ABV2SCG9_9GAMM